MYDSRVARHQVLTVVRAASVALVLVAVVVQALEIANRGGLDPTRFFAYFTIQSNLIGVAALTWLVVNRRTPRPRALELLRGAAAVYLTITFFVVIFLLSGVDVGLQLPWVDFVLHKLFPVVVVLDWVIDPPTIRLANHAALIWMTYPIAWLGLTLLRGAADGWYPYPFLDPANGGYGQVAIITAGVAIVFFLVSFVVIALSRLRTRPASLLPAS